MDCTCKCNDLTKDLIKDEAVQERMAEFFKAFSEPIRVKILLALLGNEMCVFALAELLNTSQPRISNQLKLLKQHKLIKARKDKNFIYYSLDDNHIEEILRVGMNHIKHSQQGEN